MSSLHENPDRFELDAYLDGVLPDQQREAMAREINTNRELQAEISLQERIDACLRQSFAPPSAPAMLVSTRNLERPDEGMTVRSPQRRRMMLVVVATAATIVWGMLAWQFLAKDSKTPRYNPNIPLATIYETRVAEGFRPTWVCEDDRQFASTFLTRQGQGLLLSAMPEGRKMVGLTYCGGLSRYTTTMLARVEGTPVMVFVDRASADNHPAQPPGETGLHLFRKELGPLVLYELTPLDRPRVMDYLYPADVPN